MSDQAFIFNPRSDRLAAAGTGFQVPRLTSGQRLTLTVSQGDAGMQVFDVSLSAMFVWLGNAWLQLGSGSLPYSEGTFEASFLPASGSITLDPARKTGRWSRIGNQVTAVGRFTVLSVVSPTGALVIDNLPFPVATGYEAAAVVAVNGLANAARTAISARVNGTGVTVWHYDSGSLLDIASHVLPLSEWNLSATYLTA